MKANYKQRAAEARIPRETMARFMMRASLEESAQKKIDEYEGRRKQELSAYASAVDATMLFTLHVEKGYGPKRLRQIWEAFIRNRIKFRLFFRDEDSGYVEQETGNNVEDFAIHRALRNIGADVEAWEQEEIRIDQETGEVSFHASKC